MAKVEKEVVETAVVKEEEVKAPEVIEFGGKWIAQINGQVVTFDTESEARTELEISKNKAAFEATAAAYCDARKHEGKNRVTKTNQIIDFLAWEATK